MNSTRTSPIDIILAGRSASGCDKYGCLLFERQQPTDNDHEEFLSLTISGELCGINIMQIREIIKPQSVTEIPGAPSYVSGIISLRGDIIPVLDTHLRLGLKHSPSTGKERVVVVKGDTGLTGLLVDRLIRVVSVPGSAILSVPIAFSGIDREFVRGVGRIVDRAIILMNVERIVDIQSW